MPIYEFICDSCGHEFERIVSFSAATAPACPACEASDVKRRMSKPAIHFKGSGWYITDSKKSNGSNGSHSSEKNGSEAKSDAPQAESAKSESTTSESSKTESSKTDSSVKAEA
jgi:putative FmdB family regulatory protein